MAPSNQTDLIDALLDSWDRNNTILLNLLHAVPAGALEVRPMEESPTVAQLFTHVHYVRVMFVREDAPEYATNAPEQEWANETDPARIGAMLAESARVVKNAVKGRLEAGRDLDRHFDHPLLLFQLLIWHEGYHHGQIKLALKLAGHAIPDDQAGPLTWGVWIRKT